MISEHGDFFLYTNVHIHEMRQYNMLTASGFLQLLVLLLVSLHWQWFAAVRPVVAKTVEELLEILTHTHTHKGCTK